MELLLSSSSFSLSSASQPSTFSSEIHRSFYQVAAKSITPNGVSVLLANPSLDSLSDLPDIVVQIVDLKPSGNRYILLK
ncbi:replication protein A 70 kDa DNA-binding subunit D-like isoform X1 [Vigna radiata var. radiata]|uniref:Replication protein A 70 kDa DNA-binding subunit D-like isoform X1 n=1 Tax=Vigna radiata var. radiata TaxID=3916 RepID=A0A3Q0ELU7_VIGRR|nr:replication protein A 70 kDa DNA-binding subunit D-like isoform X1 [Vigna radiata var. radiata]